MRMMEWNDTNGSTQVNWQDRATQNYFTATGPDRSVLRRHHCLANEANKDLWINVPAMATSTYIEDLAQLIYQDLNPNLNVYVEYSNETWNTGFPQYNQVLAAADNNPLVTEKNNNGFAVGQQTAFEINAIGATFKQVFGSQASRVLPVLGGWTATPLTTRWSSSSCRPTMVPASNSIAAFDIAPYVTMATGTDEAGLTHDRSLRVHGE